MADGQEEDFSQLPLADRFQHKQWKVRKEGYEAAVKEFELTPDESDPAFRPFIQDPGLWKGAAADANVAAQQEGLAALCAFLKYGGQQGASRSRPMTIQPICEKALISTRPAAKANALEALLLYVEVDRPDSVVEELLPALTHKLPKVVAATLAALTSIFHNFGIKLVDPKPVLKLLPKVFGHADKNVRAEASNLTVELYRWLKEAMKPIFWGELKPMQQQDLDKLFEKVKEEPSPKQERLTRVQQAQQATAQAVVADDLGGDAVMVEEEEDEPVEVDAFDLAEPVDACSKIPAEFHDLIASSKWKERKDALEDLLKILDTPRLKDGPYDDVIRALAKSMKDANVAVVTVAANCIEKLAFGLRKSFSKYRSSIMTPVMERLKEKKQSVADALGAALDAIFVATSLTDCLEDILTHIPNKNPNVKQETVKFLIRSLRNTRDVPTKDEQKQIADAGTKLLTESTEAMRSGGAEVLGTLMKIIGERAMGPYLDGLDDIRKTKIKEFFDTAEVKAKEKPKPVVAPKAAPTSAVGKKVVGAGAKKPVARKPAAAVAEDPAPLQPRPTAKVLPKTGGLQKPGVSALKLGGLKKPVASTASSSPQRRVISPASLEDEEVIAPSPSKFGPGRGGLAGRPLSRPVATPASPSPVPISNSISHMERAELEELRAEKDRLQGMNDHLRGSNARLNAEIAELQNQNAQLIEDHTRDVLQIKAKETQLVRAKGECDVLRSEMESIRKETERYKREVSRLGRENLGRERDEVFRGRSQMNEPSENGIYDDNSSRAPQSYHQSPRPNGHLERPGSAALQRTGSVTSTGSRPPQPRPQSHMSSVSPNEEKENDGFESLSAAAARRKISPPSNNGGSTYGTVRSNRSPQRQNGGGTRDANTASHTSNGESGENWKRAAEVTSQLKARIEAMKVCGNMTENKEPSLTRYQARQGLTKPSY